MMRRWRQGITSRDTRRTRSDGLPGYCLVQDVHSIVLNIPSRGVIIVRVNSSRAARCSRTLSHTLRCLPLSPTTCSEPAIWSLYRRGYWLGLRTTTDPQGCCTWCCVSLSPWWVQQRASSESTPVVLPAARAPCRTHCDASRFLPRPVLSLPYGHYTGEVTGWACAPPLTPRAAARGAV